MPEGMIKPSLRRLSEAQVLKAIAGGDEDNLILQELAALINAYVRECSRLKAQGKDPYAFLHRRVTCPIESIALTMVAAALKSKD
jgi:hypothetical protein